MSSYKKHFLCRICNKYSVQCVLLKNTYLIHEERLSYEEIIKTCTSIQMSTKDNFPQTICRSCALVARSSYKFIKVCEKSEKHWLEISSNLITPKKSPNESWEHSYAYEHSAMPFITYLKVKSKTDGSTSANEETGYHKLDSSEEGEEQEEEEDDEKEEELEKEEKEILILPEEIKLEIHDEEWNTDLQNNEIKIEYLDYDEMNPTEYGIENDKIEDTLLTNMPATSMTPVETIYDTVKCEATPEITWKKMSTASEASNSQKSVAIPGIIWKKKQLTKNKLQFQCSKCKKMFASKNKCVYHIRHIHRPRCTEMKKDQPLEPEKTCLICKLVFRYPCYLEDHNKRKHSVLKKTCAFCSFSTFEGILYGKHMRDYHPEKKTFQCDQENCTSSFFTQKRLKSHISWVHNRSDTVRFCCEVCGISFVQERALKAHSLMHSNIRNHVCKICGKCFKSKGVMTRHERRVHADPHIKCTVCAKEFKAKDYLKIHMETHSDSRPTYSCVDCGKSYFNKWKLADHKKNHTSSTLFKCEVCDTCFSGKRKLSEHLKRDHREIKSDYD